MWPVGNSQNNKIIVGKRIFLYFKLVASGSIQIKRRIRKYVNDMDPPTQSLKLLPQLFLSTLASKTKAYMVAL